MVSAWARMKAISRNVVIGPTNFPYHGCHILHVGHVPFTNILVELRSTYKLDDENSSISENGSHIAECDFGQQNPLTMPPMSCTFDTSHWVMFGFEWYMPQSCWKKFNMLDHEGYQTCHCNAYSPARVNLQKKSPSMLVTRLVSQSSILPYIASSFGRIKPCLQ